MLEISLIIPGPSEVTKDEYPRSGSTFEGFQKLRPAFVKDGTGSVTAGNASGKSLVELQPRSPEETH